MNFTEMRNNIIRIDCLDGLKQIPDNSVDAIVTSPPYNVSKDIGLGGKIVNRMVYDSYEDDLSEEEYQNWQIEILNECHRVLKNTGSMFYNHKVRYRDGDCIHPMDWLRKTKFLIHQEIVWDRILAANIRGWRFWQVDERVYWLAKEKKLAEIPIDSAKKGSVWRFHGNGLKEHPCPYPELLVENCLSTQGKGCLVLDPFVGSGTTAIVAKNLGMDYIGFDVSQVYVDIAKKRVAEASGPVKPTLDRFITL